MCEQVTALPRSRSSSSQISGCVAMSKAVYRGRIAVAAAARGDAPLRQAVLQECTGAATRPKCCRCSGMRQGSRQQP